MMTMTTTMMMLDMTDTCKVRYKSVRVNIVTLFEKKFFIKIFLQKSSPDVVIKVKQSEC